MKAQTVITHAPVLVEGDVSMISIASNFRSLSVTDQDLVRRFRDMINFGKGGAMGMHASTRVDALVGLAWLLKVNCEAAVKIASSISLGARSQGTAVSNLIEATRAARG